MVAPAIERRAALTKRYLAVARPLPHALQRLVAATSMNSPKGTPTVAYDSEQPPTTPLEPPDVPRLLKSKRHRLRFAGGMPRLSLELPRPLQLVATCSTIALSAVSANGVYCWATYGPVVARTLALSGPEAQTIVVGGILGVYLSAAPLGSLTDRMGPRFASLVSAGLSALGYLSFAAILRLEHPPEHVYIYLTAAYFAVGAATVGSYFAALTCASLSFPSHPTLSLSLPLSLIGLSSLVLSSFSALPLFHTPSSPELDAPRFLTFLGTLGPAVNLLAAMFMRVIPQPIALEADDDHASPDDPEAQVAGSATPHASTYGAADDPLEPPEMPGSPMSQLLHLDEHTPLIIGGPERARKDAEARQVGVAEGWTALGLARNPGFWVFGILLALCIGPAETIIASIGSILTSLLPKELVLQLLPEVSLVALLSSPAAEATPAALHTLTANPLALRNKHVFILSLSSTVARLSTGVLADYLAPPPVAQPNPDPSPDAPPHVFVQARPVRLLRASFAALCSLALAAVFGWCAGMLTDEGGMWVLSMGTGAMYGALFTLTPAIISSHFGPTNFGLAWGMVSYFPALGSVIFSYAYAILQEQAAAAADVCLGPRCFRPTLAIAAACCALASIGIWATGRQWRT